MNSSVLCFGKTPIAKKSMDKRGGVSRFCVDNFLSHCAENFRRRESLSVSLVSDIKKFGEGGNINIFRLNFFCLLLPNNFVGEHFSISIISGTDKVCIRGGRGINFFRRKFFVS